MKGKYEVESVINIINISCWLDPRFMVRYFDDEETTNTCQTIIQEGITVARRIEEQHSPQSVQPETQESKSTYRDSC